MVFVFFTAAHTTCSCYLYTTTGNSWKENRQMCHQTPGRDLVSMETAEEWEFIKNATQSRSSDTSDEWHIGLYRDPEITGNWTWVSGKPLTIRRWQPSKPDGNSFALVSKNWPKDKYGLFNSIKESWHKAYICEWTCKYDLKLYCGLPMIEEWHRRGEHVNVNRLAAPWHIARVTFAINTSSYYYLGNNCRLNPAVTQAVHGTRQAGEQGVGLHF